MVTTMGIWMTMTTSMSTLPRKRGCMTKPMITLSETTAVNMSMIMDMMATITGMIMPMPMTMPMTMTTTMGTLLSMTMTPIMRTTPAAMVTGILMAIMGMDTGMR